MPLVRAKMRASSAAAARAAGGLIVADEVQAGYGRTGQWWGYDAVGLAPDIVVTGKPMGAGLPLAATTARRDVVEQFRAEARYFNTFAASPLQGAVGLAVLDVIEEEGLIEHARTLGAELKAALRQRFGLGAFDQGLVQGLGEVHVGGGGDRPADRRRQRQKPRHHRRMHRRHFP